VVKQTKLFFPQFRLSLGHTSSVSLLRLWQLPF